MRVEKIKENAKFPKGKAMMFVNMLNNLMNIKIFNLCKQNAYLKVIENYIYYIL